jgi:hypothetical protein
MAGLPRRADLAAEPVVDPVQRPVATPLASGADDIQDGIEDIPQVEGKGSGAEGLNRLRRPYRIPTH